MMHDISETKRTRYQELLNKYPDRFVSLMVTIRARRSDRSASLGVTDDRTIILLVTGVAIGEPNRLITTEGECHFTEGSAIEILRISADIPTLVVPRDS